MSTRRGTLGRVGLLALVSAGGIVGMLLAEGLWDGLFFALTALPLLVGGWRAYMHRHDDRRRAPPEIR